MRTVVIAVLSYSGQPHSQVKNEVFQAAQAMMARGWTAIMSERVGACMIPHVRNAAVSEFLMNKEATDLIFVDDDNYCDTAGFLRLVDADVDIVAAPCRSRSEPLTWPIRWLQQTIQRSLNGLVEVETVGTGIMRVRRQVFEKMIEAEPDSWYKDATSKAGKSWALFDYGVEAHDWWGEDVRFCRRWRALGGKVWIDPDITTHHIGRHDFSGSVGAWLREMPTEIQVNTHVKNEFGTEPTEKIAICLATRGRAELCAKTSGITMANASLKSTQLVIGTDDDDDEISISGPGPNGSTPIVSIAKREGSIGAKYNRCSKAVDAHDLYLISTDDVAITTKGWDRILIEEAKNLKDGIGIIFLRNMLGGIAVTKRLVEIRGHLCVPDFPFWWHDTELMEIGKMIGRIREAPIDVQLMIPLEKNSRGVRDIAFWAKFFDATRPLRVAMAERIIDQMDESLPHKDALRHKIPALISEFEKSNAALCDPEDAAKKEEFFSFDAPDDERYQQIKGAAEDFMLRAA